MNCDMPRRLISMGEHDSYQLMFDDASSLGIEVLSNA
jgi:hypothetical protein